MNTETKEIVKLIENIEEQIINNNEEKVVELSQKLNSIISNNFEKSNTKVLFELLEISNFKKDSLFSEILQEELDFEVENVLYEDKNGNDIESTMFLIPCIITSQSERFNVHSINQIEDVLRKSLIANKTIQEEKQLNLGTIRLSESDVDVLSKQDWWDIHRDIINDINFNIDSQSDNEKIRNTVLSYEPKSSVSIFYLVLTISNIDSNSDICEKIYELESDTNFWGNMLENFEEDSKVNFTLLPIMPISEGIENAKFILEGVTFELFFESSIEESSAVAYCQIKDDSSKYVAFFFDEETKYLNGFYYFNTYDEPQSFVCQLVELCLNHNEIPLYSISEEIKKSTLDLWKDSKKMIDFDKYILESNRIDLLESIKFCSFSDFSDTITNNNNLLH